MNLSKQERTDLYTNLVDKILARSREMLSRRDKKKKLKFRRYESLIKKESQ